MATASTNYFEPGQARLVLNVRAIIADKTQADAADLSDEITLGDLGLDSLALSDLAEAIEDRFDVHVANRMLPSTLTVGQLIALVCNNHAVYGDSPDNAIVPEPAD